jgi:c(7)-type cytochrome triheme protein
MSRAATVLAFTWLLCLAGQAADGEELGDVKFRRAEPGGMEIPPAIFPHAIHRIAYKCTACHDRLFPMKAGSTKMTMDAIQAGKFCGTCHNSQLAFSSSFATCSRCHRE